MVAVGTVIYYPVWGKPPYVSFTVFKTGGRLPGKFFMSEEECALHIALVLAKWKDLYRYSP